MNAHYRNHTIRLSPTTVHAPKGHHVIMTENKVVGYVMPHPHGHWCGSITIGDWNGSCDAPSAEIAYHSVVDAAIAKARGD